MIHLIDLFDSLFAESEDTVVIRGANEPLYAPKFYDHVGIIELNDDVEVPLNKHRIYFRHDYVSSLLHEVSHWCIAGSERRQQLDYGYWYSPDDRDKSEQLLFEKVEVKPQALEHLFSRACGIAFRVSVDNFSLLDHDIKPFRDAVLTQSEKFMRDGMPARAALFLQGLNALDVNINTNLDPSDLHQCDALQLGSRNNVDGVSDCIDCE